MAGGFRGSGPKLILPRSQSQAMLFNAAQHIGNIVEKGVDIYDIVSNMLKVTTSKDVQNKVIRTSNEIHKKSYKILPYKDTMFK